MGWEEMPATCAAGGVKGRVEVVRPMAPAPRDHPHHLLLGFPDGRHDLMHIWAPCLGSKVRDALREAFGGPVRHRPKDTAHHTAGAPAPGARAEPHLAFARCVTFAWTLAPRACGQRRTRRCTPPARPGQGQAPQEGVIFITPQARALASLGLEGRQGDRRRGEGRRRGIKMPGGAGGTYAFFSCTADTCATELDPSVGGEPGRECAATPLRVERAMLKRVLSDETIAMVCSLTGACGGTTGAWTIH